MGEHMSIPRKPLMTRHGARKPAWLAVASAAAILLCGSAAEATKINTYEVQFPPGGNPPPPAFPQQKFGDVTFTRDGATAPAGPGKIKLVGKISFTNVQYPLDLANVVGPDERYSSVDSLFQICYAGGYVEPLVSASAAGVGPANYTIAAATGWYQTARNDDNFFGAGPGKNNKLLNFTDSYREDVRAIPNDGMLDYFLSATGNSPYTPPQPPAKVPAFVNYAIYASPDPVAGPPAVDNDGRVLGDENLGQDNQARQFVILAAWNLPNYRRYAVNTLRMYDLITRELGVPKNQVAILYGNPQVANLGPFPGPINGDPNGLLPPAAPGGALGTVAVNGPNTRQGWLDALSGKFFLGADGKPMAAEPGDKLFVYSTGHGGLNTKFTGVVATSGNQEDYFLDLQGKYNLTTTGDLVQDLSIADLADDEASLQQNIQLSFRQPLPLGTHLILNGHDVGSLDSALITDPSQILPIDPFVTDAPYSYSLTVPQAFFTDTDHIDFLLNGPSADPALASLAAIDISGGDQELLVSIPEPGVGMLLLISLGVIARRRRRTIGDT